MMTDQFAPIDKPYLTQWRERLDAEKLVKTIKRVKAKRKKAKGKKK